MARPVETWGDDVRSPELRSIREIIRDFFDAQGTPFDLAFYSRWVE